MNLVETFRIGIGGLASHKLRTFLTMLGIMFGIAAVIAMLSIGEGAKQQALEQISLLGVRNILVKYVDPPDENEEERGRNEGVKGLTPEDGNSIKKVIPSVRSVTAQKELKITLRDRGKPVDANILGVSHDYDEVLNLFMSKGQFFSAEDSRRANKVCVLGSRIVRKLFPFDDPVSKRIKIGDQWFLVIGVAAGKQTSGDESGGIKIRDMNRDVYMPLSTAVKRFGRWKYENRDSEVDMIVAKVSAESDIGGVASVIERLMNRRHKERKDFRIVVPELLIKQSQQTQRIFNIVMGCIAGLSLLVGGIGIMNIMLASVFERTREIGVRRAVGAMKKDVLGQFLIEAVTISLIGGFIGIIIGFALTGIITFYAGWRTIIAFSSIFLAFGVSSAVGVIFGIYPAYRAAGLDPIDALRYE